MASTITTPGAYDALEKAAPGEPMFPLLARDPCAPAAITEWCRLRRNRALRLWGESERATDKELLAADFRQCANAEAIALDFADWRNSHQQEVEGERASYQAVIKSAEEQAAAARRKVRDHLLRSLREAAFHLCEAKETARQLELFMAGGAFEGFEGDVNRWANELAEQRPSAQLPLGA